jgi:hypothetical protein
LLFTVFPTYTTRLVLENYSSKVDPCVSLKDCGSITKIRDSAINEKPMTVINKAYNQFIRNLINRLIKSKAKQAKQVIEISHNHMYDNTKIALQIQMTGFI